MHVVQPRGEVWKKIHLTALGKQAFKISCISIFLQNTETNDFGLYPPLSRGQDAASICPQNVCRIVLPQHPAVLLATGLKGYIQCPCTAEQP